MSSSDIWEHLTSTSKLERDKGVSQFEDSLKAGDVPNDLVGRLAEFPLLSEGVAWESKLGVLLGAKIFALEGGIKCNDAFLNVMAPAALSLLSDDEVRVRQAAGELLGAFCRIFGPRVYEQAESTVFNLIQTNLERSELSDEQQMDENGGKTRRRYSEASEIFHETAGWRNLETSVKCLEAMVAGCGTRFAPYINQTMIDLIYRSLRHTNRFVRESGYQTCATLIDAASEDVYAKFGVDFASHLAEGLADNWSQVRLAATVATRPYLLLGKAGPTKDMIMAILAPRLCLNRYYLAEGVRIYSQNTWIDVTAGTTGKKVVETYISETVAYYSKCTNADNHAVREAACQCIAELALKINHEILNPYVDSLLDTLLACFRDDSWPVRDMACVASGSFIKSFPDASRKAVPVLLEQFFKNLRDPISSVRQGAAAALANTLRAYGKAEVWDEIGPKIVEGLKGISEQPDECLRYTDYGASEFGVAKRLRDNDIELHENQQMYSCGSLAPKMGKGGGCSDARFQKPSEPWEYADGCIYFIHEASCLPDCQSEIAQKFLPLIISACKYRQYTLHYIFFETVTKTLPGIAQNLGKKLFKPFLEDFFEAIFYACENENPLASCSGRRCLRDLANFLGPNIFRGRVEQYHPKYLSIVDNALEETEEEMLAAALSAASQASGSGPVAISKPHAPTLGGTPTGSPRH